MSKYDAGKHPKYTEDNTPNKASIGKQIPETKRLDPQKSTRTTALRQADYDANKGLNAAAFHRPGTQNKAK